MQYDLNLLRAFEALMAERSVTRAAQRLNMTQPALSNAMRRLRDLFQDPLFIRERFGMRPTETAVAIAPTISEALAALDRTVLAQQSFEPATATRDFVLAASGLMEFVLVPSLVGRIAQRAPNIRVRVLPYSNDVGATGVNTGDTDAVIGRVPEPSDNLVVHELMRDGLVCVLRADHPEVGDTLARDQLERLGHVNVLPPGRLRVGLFEAFERHGIRRNVQASVSHFLALPGVLATTDYCAVVPRLLAPHFGGDPRLKLLEPPVDLGDFPVHLAWHVRYRDDPAHAWLRGQIRALAEEIAGEGETATSALIEGGHAPTDTS